MRCARGYPPSLYLQRRQAIMNNRATNKRELTVDQDDHTFVTWNHDATYKTLWICMATSHGSVIVCLCTVPEIGE